LEVENVWQKP